MARISVFSPEFARVLFATGPGIHTDEASAALSVLPLSALLRRTIASAGEVSPERAANPRGPLFDRAGKAIIDPRTGLQKRGLLRNLEVIQFERDLYRAAFLTTGQWGPRSSQLRHSGPTRVQNPRGGRWLYGVSFFDRMRLLQQHLRAVEANSTAVYDSIDTPLGASRKWVQEMRRCLVGVDYVLSQERAAREGRARILASNSSGLERPFGLEDDSLWGIIAAKGNVKLPYASYSALPVATCQGAGRCAAYEAEDYQEQKTVYKDRDGTPIPEGAVITRSGKRPRIKGYCYSLAAWRMASPFTRMFLSTLAHTADREFAIMAASGGRDVLLEQYDERVQLALSPRGREARFWPQYVKGEIFAAVRRALVQGETAFCRLFVDGDIDHEDDIVEWMDVCRDLGPQGADIQKLRERLDTEEGRDSLRRVIHLDTNEAGDREEFCRAKDLQWVEFYGYTKCWQQFVNVDDIYKTAAWQGWNPGEYWPANYTVNLSTDSVYATTSSEYADVVGLDDQSGRVRTRMEMLPITRGYFATMDQTKYIKRLEGIYDVNERDPKKVLRVFHPPDPKQLQFVLKPERLTEFLRINEELRVPRVTLEQEQAWADEVSLRAAAEMQRSLEDKSYKPQKGRTRQESGERRIARLVPKVRTQVTLDFLAPFLSRVNELRRAFGAARDFEWSKEKLASSALISSVVSQARKSVYSVWISHVLADNAFRRIVQQELQLDAVGERNEQAYLDYVARHERAQVENLVAQGMSVEKAVRSRAYHPKFMGDKALALAMHEVLLSTTDKGATCPLSCGNCSDQTNPRAKGLHRCASKDEAYKRRTIYIAKHGGGDKGEADL